MSPIQRLAAHPDIATLSPFYAYRRVAWRLNLTPASPPTAELQPVNDHLPIPTCHRTNKPQPALSSDQIGTLNTVTRAIKADCHVGGTRAALLQTATS